MPRTAADLVGQQFGQLTVLELVEQDTKSHRSYLVQCACGSAPKVVRASSMLQGDVHSCGCLVHKHVEKLKRSFWRYANRKETHGASESDNR